MATPLVTNGTVDSRVADVFASLSWNKKGTLPGKYLLMSDERYMVISYDKKRFESFFEVKEGFFNTDTRSFIYQFLNSDKAVGFVPLSHGIETLVRRMNLSPQFTGQKVGNYRAVVYGKR